MIEETAFLDLTNHPAEFPKSRSIKKISSLNTGKITGEIVNKDKTLSILITENNSEKIELTIPYYSLPYLLPLDTSKEDAFQTNVQILVPNQTKTSLERFSLNEQALQFKDWKINERKDQLTLAAQINPETLSSGIYQMNVELIPQKFQDPQWWEKWNFDERNFDRDDSQNFDGSTTLNLRLFLQGLKSSTTDLVQSQSPAAAHLCFAVQKKDNVDDYKAY